MSVVENNKLIAEFMGHKIDWGFNKDSILYMPQGEGNATNNSVVIGLDELPYHTSWDWLMPVVKKIEEIASEDVPGSHKIHRFSVRIENIECWVIDNKEVKVLTYEDSGDKKNNVYTAVAEFIKIYNRHA